jgi:hypothetical protein
MEASGSTKCCISQLTRNSRKDNQFIFPCQPPCLLLCVVYTSHNYNEVHSNQKNSTQVRITVLKRNTNQYSYLFIRRQSKTEDSAIEDNMSNCYIDGDSLHNLNFEWHATCKIKRYSFCLMVEASDHGYVLHTRRIYVFSINGD